MYIFLNNISDRDTGQRVTLNFLSRHTTALNIQIIYRQKEVHIASAYTVPYHNITHSGVIYSVLKSKY